MFSSLGLKKKKVREKKENEKDSVFQKPRGYKVANCQIWHPLEAVKMGAVLCPLNHGI